jgi:hypothetical protein
MEDIQTGRTAGASVPPDRTSVTGCTLLGPAVARPAWPTAGETIIAWAPPATRVRRNGEAGLMDQADQRCEHVRDANPQVRGMTANPAVGRAGDRQAVAVPCAYPCRHRGLARGAVPADQHLRRMLWGVAADVRGDARCGDRAGLAWGRRAAGLSGQPAELRSRLPRAARASRRACRALPLDQPGGGPGAARWRVFGQARSER